MDIKKTQK